MALTMSMGFLKAKRISIIQVVGTKNATLYVGICSYMDGNGQFCRENRTWDIDFLRTQ